MNIHVIISSLGSGAKPIAVELQKTLIRKNNLQNSVAIIPYGTYRTPRNDYKFLGFEKRLNNRVLKNPDLKDIIISGPGVLVSHELLLERFPDATLYFIERKDPTFENQQKNKFVKKRKLNSLVVWKNFKEKCNQGLLELKSKHQLDFKSWKNFYYNLDSDNIEIVETRQTTLPYLKQVAMVKLK
jgi:hypothetical protein